MGTKPPTELVVIEDGLLAGMAASDKFTREFPFLKGLAAAPARRGGCGRCGSRAPSQAAAFRAAKATIAGLASDRKRRLKELLNARQARVTYLNAGQKAVQLTF